MSTDKTLEQIKADYKKAVIRFLEATDPLQPEPTEFSGLAGRIRQWDESVRVGIWYQSAVSGCWYRSKKAAGDISCVRIDGVNFYPSRETW